MVASAGSVAAVAAGELAAAGVAAVAVEARTGAGEPQLEGRGGEGS